MRTAIAVLALVLLVAVVACNDSNDDPISAKTYSLSLASQEWMSHTGFPRTAKLTLDVDEITSRGVRPAVDGTVVEVTLTYVADGSHQSMDVPTEDGFAIFEVEFEAAGTVEVEAQARGTVLSLSLSVAGAGS